MDFLVQQSLYWMNNMPEKTDWQKRYESLLIAFSQLKENYDQQEKTLVFLKQQLSNADQAVEINKNLIRQLNEEHNKKEQQMVYFMNKLKDKLREFGYADFNRLGE